jgi:hypothetical protein
MSEELKSCLPAVAGCPNRCVRKPPMAAAYSAPDSEGNSQPESASEESASGGYETAVVDSRPSAQDEAVAAVPDAVAVE